MEALILSCGTGGGHNAAGYAVKEELERRGHHVEMMNPYSLKSRELSNRVDKTYIRMAQRVPRAFGQVYKLGALVSRLPWHSPVYQVNGAMRKQMQDYLEENHYDVVIMPHLFPAEILTNMKRHGMPVPKMMFIATDYACIPFTQETECDVYVIPGEGLKEEFLEKGIPEEKLLPVGIPVKRRFGVSQDQNRLRRLLGMEPEKTYILVVGGSIGAGALSKVIRLLRMHYSKEQVGIVAITGNNGKLYEELKRTYQDQIILLKQTGRMAEYMKACDLVLSKPGGLSSTEAAVAGTALIHITPIPGCETKNMNYFQKNGMSMAVCKPNKELTAACDLLLTCPERAEEMKEQQRKYINPRAAEEVCDYLERMCNNLKNV